MFKTVQKNEFRKNSKAKRGNCFNWENIVLIILQYNIKSEIMAKLNIYHLFATALVLIRSGSQKREKKIKKEEEGVSGSDLYFLIKQLAVLNKA